MLVPSRLEVTIPAFFKIDKCLDTVEISLLTISCSLQTHISPEDRDLTIKSRLGCPKALKISACFCKLISA